MAEKSRDMFVTFKNDPCEKIRCSPFRPTL